MNKNIKLITQIIFYGSLWGFLEATVGHVLHFIPATIAGSIMFPIASLILYKAYKKTNSKMTLLYVGLVATLIKSVDFLLPQLSVYKTINPMISIVLESLVVVLVVNMLVSKKPAIKYSSLPLASIIWRGVFVFYMTIQFLVTGNLAPYINSIQNILMFVVVTGLISGLFSSLLIFADSKITGKMREFSVRPLFASLLLIIAIISTYTL